MKTNPFLLAALAALCTVPFVSAANAPSPTAVQTAPQPSALSPDQRAAATLAELKKNNPNILIVPAIPTEELNVGKTAEHIAEEARLNGYPKTFIPIRRAPLHAAIRVISESLEMSYIAPSAEDFNETVSISVEENPWRLLAVLADTYGFHYEYKDRVWRFYRLDPFAPITMSYKIKYNDMQGVQLTTSSLNDSLSHGGGSLGSGGGSTPGGKAGGGSGSGGGSAIKIDQSRIVSDVMKICEQETTGFKPALKIGGSAGAFSFAPVGGYSAFKKKQAVKANVNYVVDSQTLIVTTTPQIHAYIQQYLAVVDQPTKHIQFGVLVVETEKSGGLDLGINWKNVSGTQVTLGDISTNINPQQVNGLPHFGRTGWPNAVLSVSDMSLIFNFLRTDSTSAVSQNPVIVARNNERTKISSSTSEPIRSASSGMTTGAGVNNQETIEYLEIGTTIEVIPQVMDADPQIGDGKSASVKLTVVLSFKDIIGQKIIGETEYPIVASRDYAYSVIVPDGYSLAIGGLQNTKSKQVDSKVPVLGDVPLLGRLFKSSSAEKTTTNMVAFVTPHIITPGDFQRGGVEQLPTKAEGAKAVSTQQGFVGFIDFDDTYETTGVGERQYRVVPKEIPPASVGPGEIREVSPLPQSLPPPAAAPAPTPNAPGTESSPVASATLPNVSVTPIGHVPF